jgi:hypothetical protein
MAVRLVSLVGNVVLRALVGLVVGYSLLTNFTAAALAAWMQCGWLPGRMRRWPSCWRTPGHGAWSLEWRRAATEPVTQCVGYNCRLVEAASCPVSWT